MYTFPHPDDLNRMIQDIHKAKELADIVVMSIHWGIHFTEAEIADYQRYYAHFAIDHGVDLILGHHAHIMLAMRLNEFNLRETRSIDDKTVSIRYPAFSLLSGHITTINHNVFTYNK